MTKKIAVIGAAGHVGLPFSLILADSGHDVIGIDVSYESCENLMKGILPFKEEGAEELLSKTLNNKKITFTTQHSRVSECDAVAIMIGTPVDAEGNPRVDDIIDYVKYSLVPYMRNNTLIILRSTVAPGTTELIQNIIQKESKSADVVFAPERVAQGVAILESKLFPQIIGANSEEAFNSAKQIFSFVSDCIMLTPREAEFGKLITNMYRYVTFALANEFYMIGSDQGLNVHKVIDAVNKNYHRMSLPKPGPNVGGPCLFKDGKFLLEDVHYPELIQTSFLINEGMPEYMYKKILSLNPNTKKIGILGATFKADCDDLRNSLSFKFAKICKRHGIDYGLLDPYLEHTWPIQNIDGYDAFIIMTPHKQFKEFYEEHLSKKPGIIIADGWKFLDKSKTTIDGVYVI